MNDIDINGLVPPSLKQDPLLGKLIEEFSSSSDRLNLPSKKQNPLLRILKSGDDGLSGNLKVPKYRQDPLLRQLKYNPEKFQDDFMKLPKEAQTELVGKLKSGELGKGFNEDKLVPPKLKQDLLLKKLKINHNENINGLKAPKKEIHHFRLSEYDDDLTAPDRHQDPFLDQLLPRQPKEGFIDLPDSDQDPLLGILKEDQQDKHVLEAPNTKVEDDEFTEPEFDLPEEITEADNDMIEELSTPGNQLNPFQTPRMIDSNEIRTPSKEQDGLGDRRTGGLLSPPSHDNLLKSLQKIRDKFSGKLPRRPSKDKPEEKFFKPKMRNNPLLKMIQKNMGPKHQDLFR